MVKRNNLLAVAVAASVATLPFAANAQFSTPADVQNGTNIVKDWFTQQLNEATKVLDQALRAQQAEQTANTQAQAKHAEQIADAVDANADLRNRKTVQAQIMNQQRMTPENARLYCIAAVEGNQTNAQNAVGRALWGSNNDRAAERSRTPMSSELQTANAFKNWQQRYCDQAGADEKVCTLPRDPALINADIKADNLYNRISHTTETAEAAARFAETIAEPLPAEQISPRQANTSPAVRERFMAERNQSQRASLITAFFNDIGWRAVPTAAATTEQKAAMKAAGFTGTTDKVSWMQTMENHVAKRFGNDTYFTTGMARDRSAEALLVELNQQIALSNRLIWEQYQLLQRIGGVAASNAATAIVSNPASDIVSRANR
jgi:hypothetical protein